MKPLSTGDVLRRIAGPKPPKKAGAKSGAEPPHPKLKTQLETIREVMLSAAECSSWLTLAEIAATVRFGEASISAQLRHLRKPKMGGYRVIKRRRLGTVRIVHARQKGPGGIWERANVLAAGPFEYRIEAQR